MAGDEQIDEAVSYLSRLTGETISADQPLRLRSVERAALASWARKQQLPIRVDVITSGMPFSVRDLLARQGGVPDTSVTDRSKSEGSQAPPVEPVQYSGAILGIGIDIEEVDALPPADDYREHPFYRDNFTQAEITYCIRQADVRASFCGTWAAKEALFKSGLFSASSDGLRAIEIVRDERGRPAVPGCQLSISHTARTAAAVCIAMAAMPATVASRPSRVQGASHDISRKLAAGDKDADDRGDPSTSMVRADLHPVSLRRGTRHERLMAICAALVIIVGGAVTFAVHKWF
jgi:phosphopantetheine--protein transferase-like protein